MRSVSVLAALVLLAAPALAQAPANPPRLAFTNPPFADGGVIPDQYTAKAPKQPAGSFPLSWTNVPAGTQSFVLLMHDLDTTEDHGMGDFAHWLAFNIPGTATGLPANLPAVTHLPDGTIQPARGKMIGYVGPGAPPGAYHHYSIELYALDTKLALGDSASREEVVKAAAGHVLGKTALVGRFHR